MVLLNLASAVARYTLGKKSLKTVAKHLAKDEAADYALRAVGRRAGAAYKRFKEERNGLDRIVDDYHLTHSGIGVKGTIGALAKKYGLANELRDYKTNVLTFFRENLGYLEHVTSRLHQELGVAKPSDLEARLYSGTQKVDYLMKKIQDYKLVKEDATKKQKSEYLSDIVRDYLESVGRTDSKTRGLLELGENLRDERQTLLYVASRRTARWLLYRIAQKKGIPIDLRDEIKLKAPFRVKSAGAALKLKKKMVDYADMFNKFGKIYNSDVFGNPAYQRRPAHA